MTPNSPNYECIHEELLQEHNLQINDIQNELNYKKEKLDELKKDNEKIQESLNDIQKSVNNIVLASNRDDNHLKDIINKQDNRITALESRNNTLNWVIGIGFTAITCTVGILGFIITHLH